MAWQIAGSFPYFAEDRGELICRGAFRRTLLSNGLVYLDVDHAEDRILGSTWDQLNRLTLTDTEDGLHFVAVLQAEPVCARCPPLWGVSPAWRKHGVQDELKTYANGRRVRWIKEIPELIGLALTLNPAFRGTIGTVRVEWVPDDLDLRQRLDLELAECF